MNSRQWDREYDQLDRDLMNGLISNTEHRRQVLEMQRAEREEMMASAEQAYHDEIDRWT